MTKAIYRKDFIWAYGSRGIRVQNGGRSRKPKVYILNCKYEVESMNWK